MGGREHHEEWLEGPEGRLRWLELVRGLDV